MTDFNSEVLILGSGPAGLTAAIYSSRANLKPILLKGLEPGGQLSITTDVENFPGFSQSIQGPWLMEQMEAQAKSVGTNILDDIIVKVNLEKSPYECIGDSGNIYNSKAIIIATGASARWLNIPSEKKLRGFGVSACATCDGFFFKDKEIAVIGGGNTAAEEALFLTKFAKKVNLIHRRDKLRAEKILQERLFKNKKINFIWNHTVEEILSTGSPPSVNGINIRSVKTNKITNIGIHGVFIAIGHTPNTSIFQNKLILDNDGYIITEPDSTATNIPGVFAAGDVKDKIFRQAVTAAGHGCMAALEAEQYLSNLELN